MKCVVIYFSQTGNTERVAKAIQAGIKQAASHCDIVKMKDANPRRLYEYDLIGLGSPVFGIEPRNVILFINDMRFVGGKHVFVFNTHGTHPERYFPSVVPKLKRRGLVVIGMADWYGSVYLPEISLPYHTDGHPDDIDLKEAEGFGREMVDHSRRISAGESELIPPPPPEAKPWPALIGGVDLKKKETKFESLVKFHQEMCTYPECRLCMDNCPMDGIDLSLDPPVIAKPCTNCTFCTKICPTGALDDSDYIAIRGPMTAESQRGFLRQGLDEAEAEGRFRRLVADELVNYDNPIYKVHNKHPQWIIGKGLQ